MVGNTERRGLGGMSLALPHSGLVIFANLSNSKGSDLTFSAVFTSNRHECVRDLSSCTEVFLKRVSGPSMSSVRNLSPTVSVSRGAASGGPHSAINAIARVCSCLQLLCTEVNVPRYPIYNERVGHRSISRVISGVVRLPRNAHVRLLTPVIHNEGNRCIGRLRRTGGSNCIEIEISNSVCRLSRGVGLSGGGGRAVRVIISHLMVGSRVHSELDSSVRITAGLSNNLLNISMVNNRRVLFSRGCTYPSRNMSVRRLSPQVFSFGGPFKTYPSYANLNIFGEMSPGLVVPGSRLAVERNKVHTSN